MTNYNMGTTYTKGKIDIDYENIPQSPAFKSFAGEKHSFEVREGRVSYYQVTEAVACGMISDLDKTIISIIATFGSACITSKIIKEMLTMMDVQYNDNTFESSIKRLHRFNLINFSRFFVDSKMCASIRVITLAIYGSKFATSLGVVHRFNPMATASAEAYSVKSRLQISQLISNYLKRRFVDSFEVRPVIVVDKNRDAIVRPSASITINGIKMYFEVPRLREGWLEDLSDKLKRYELVFEGKDIPTVIINGEDEEMNREISRMIAENNYNFEILYTDDLSMFGEKFRYSIYGILSDGTKQCYEFVNLSKVC